MYFLLDYRVIELFVGRPAGQSYNIHNSQVLPEVQVVLFDHTSPACLGLLFHQGVLPCLFQSALVVLASLWDPLVRLYLFL